MLGFAEGGAHVIDAVGARENHVGDAVLAQQRELISEKRTIQQRNDRFRARHGERTQPRALAAREDDGLGRRAGVYAPGAQGCASLMSITGMPSRIG